MSEHKFTFKEVDHQGLETLKALAASNNFNRWIYDTIKPYTGGRILEIGSGIGNISQFFLQDGADEIVVHPYMLSPGRHATRDIPRMVQEAAVNHPGVEMRVTGPLGLHDKIGEVVLERAGLRSKSEPEASRATS